MTKVVRGVGWTLITSGAVVLLYVVYLLWFTGLGTAQDQAQLGEQFQRLTAEAPEGTEVDEPADPDEELDLDGVYAAMWFERDGERVVNDDVLYVVEGVSLDVLRQGPGHYPDSAAPGEDGNFSIAGHRTTYGSPFWALDELQDGDTIHVVDRDGVEWVYAYREQRVVTPTDIWVVTEDDPIDLGAPTITLTTCHPRFSAAQRLIAWGELLGPAEEI